MDFLETAWNAIKSASAGSTIIVLAALLVAIKLTSKLYYWLRYRKRIPIVVHATPELDFGGRTAISPEVAVLHGRLVEFLAEEAPGPLAPGGLASTAPELDAVAPDNNSHWMALVISLTLARPPAFHIHLTPYEGESRRVAVTLLTGHRGPVIAARVFELTAQDLVLDVGTFCVFHVQAQRRVARWIPRWERWNFERSYRAYRQGIQLHREGIELLRKAEEQEAARAATATTTRETGEKSLHAAAESFRDACVTDLSNVLPRLRRASIMELLNRRAIAMQLYAGCRDLWPENIEPAYRMIAGAQAAQAEADRAGATRIPAQRGADVPAPLAVDLVPVLVDLKRQLSRRRLLWMWARTWHPRRYNPGERRFWQSWFRPWNPGAPLTSLRFKRTEFLGAVEVAYLGHDLRKIIRGEETDRRPRGLLGRTLARLLGQRSAPPTVGITAPATTASPAPSQPGSPVPANTAASAPASTAVPAPATWLDRQLGRNLTSAQLTRALFEDVARRVIGVRRNGTAWLLAPQRIRRFRLRARTLEHGRDWHDSARPATRQPLGRNGPNATIGWLAHYNAACFLSIASRLPATDRPWECPDGDHWRDECFTAALRELGRVLRDPYTSLDASWLNTDVDLEPMRAAQRTRALATFAEYTGLTIPQLTTAASGAGPAGGLPDGQGPGNHRADPSQPAASAAQ